MFEYLIEEVPTTVYHVIMVFAASCALGLWTYRHLKYVRPSKQTEIVQLEQDVATAEYEVQQKPPVDEQKAQNARAYHAAQRLAISHVDQVDDTVARQEYDAAAHTPPQSMTDVARRRGMFAVYEASLDEQRTPEYQDTLKKLQALTEEALQWNRRHGVSQHVEEPLR